MTNITWLSRSVAKASKACRPERGGIAINIWPDGAWSESAWRGNATAKRDPNGEEWIQRLACIDWPVSIATAKEIIKAAGARR
jgi:hypothetical protein